MKYLMMCICGLLAILAGLAFTRHFFFVAPLTTWPILLTTLAALALTIVRKPWKVMTAGMVLIGASMLEFVGAFFTFIILIYCVGSAQDSLLSSFVDLLILILIGMLSLITSWLALGWGVWHTIHTPRQVFRPFVHA